MVTGEESLLLMCLGLCTWGILVVFIKNNNQKSLSKPSTAVHIYTEISIIYYTYTVQGYSSYIRVFTVYSYITLITPGK